MEKPSKKSALRDSILARKAATKPIAFSLDEVRAIAKTVDGEGRVGREGDQGGRQAVRRAPRAALERPAKPNHIKAASLADILGFNPKRTKAAEVIEEKDVPEKFKRFYKLLIDLRKHLTEGIERHSEETLKRSVEGRRRRPLRLRPAHGRRGHRHLRPRLRPQPRLQRAGGPLGDRGRDQAHPRRHLRHLRDHGASPSPRSACSPSRSPAIPPEAQKQIERNRHHSRTQAGLFGESGEEGGTIAHEDGGDE